MILHLRQGDRRAISGTQVVHTALNRCPGPKSMKLLESSILVAQLNMCSSTDIAALTSPGIVKPAENKVLLLFPACLTGRHSGGAYLEGQKIAGKLFPEELESWKSV
ncbi:hypothetical protein ILYODFUR_035655 [Ilyodon furcidens]|uniref:Uncharacterized protein n=1 Tax=Ilyodon furcidens TaxID=33524 RepID=A0ABV0UQU1_9TELE